MRRIFLLPLVLLTACGEMPKLETPSLDVGEYFSVYRQDIRQGNFVTQEMVAQLKPGQTREQVRFVLGTPLVRDPFHDNRWDYVYRYDSGKGEVLQRRLSVHFDGNVLLRLSGDVVAAEPGAARQAEVVKRREINIVPEQAPANTNAASTQTPVTR